jgi:hypothetical protein
VRAATHAWPVDNPDTLSRGQLRVRVAERHHVLFEQVDYVGGVKDFFSHIYGAFCISWHLFFPGIRIACTKHFLPALLLACFLVLG